MSRDGTPGWDPSGARGRLLPLAIVAALVVVLVVVSGSLTPFGAVGGLTAAVLLGQAALAFGLVLARREHLRSRQSADAAHRRLAATVTRQGQANKRRHQHLVERLDRNDKQRRDDFARLDGNAQRRHAHQQVRQERMHTATQRQVQALLALERMVKVEGSVPPMGAWAASPDLLELCVQELIDRRPATVVECGSGVSTLYLALAAEQYGLPSRIVALEHDVRFAASTRQLLGRHGVAHRVEIRVAPLRRGVLEGHEPAWYDPDALQDLDSIGMLLVDGPPGDGGLHARFPAMPLLLDRLAPKCLVLMDDVNRTSDREVAERWATLYPDFQLEVDDQLQKYVGLLRRDPAP